MKRKLWKKLICMGLLGSTLAFGGMAEAAVKGDVNGDGVVNETDLKMLTNYQLGKISNLPNQSNADVNNDGKIDISDITALKQLLVKNGNGSSKGDVNGDGKVDIYDINIVLSYIQGQNTSIANKSNADMDGNGKIDINDVVAIKQKAGASMEHNPQGKVEVIASPANNQITVQGYAYDEDNMNHAARIHVYVGGTAGNPNVPSYEIQANQPHSAMGNHGFKDTRTIRSDAVGAQTVHVYALNDVGSGTYKEIGSKKIFINGNINHNPQGSVSVAESPANYQLHVKGQAFDQDDMEQPVTLHVYVGGTPGASASQVPQYPIHTNPANRIFEDTRNIGNAKTGRQLVHVYAINSTGSGGNVEIWNGYVDIKGSGSNGSNGGNVRDKLIYAVFHDQNARISCDFDGYKNTSGRHEGIDIVLRHKAPVYATVSGTVTKAGGGNYNTFAIYDSSNDKTVVYLHFASIASGMYAGRYVEKGELIGYQGNTGAPQGSHVHIEVRNGRRTAAAKSVGDPTLDNSNPYEYWNRVL